MVDSDFDDPEYERRLSRLKVDVITYQDEVGCVREKFPLVRLKENWQKLRTIHDKLNIIDQEHINIPVLIFKCLLGFVLDG